ncbi:MAG: hypothetical protein ACD_4C00355G0005 [uncultured bacterium (gcode 4)]|uniref:Uncharacterized protein n=1 Tax=uncultured bacterium (gcode 4) TaxID=1234023 RepID=K2FTM5_9BACT|nr:MAG: hypothetical protein ACD_4C00355G0005 [uncultured bacterium (gcode 4)]
MPDKKLDIFAKNHSPEFWLDEFSLKEYFSSIENTRWLGEQYPEILQETILNEDTPLNKPNTISVINSVLLSFYKIF